MVSSPVTTSRIAASHSSTIWLKRATSSLRPSGDQASGAYVQASPAPSLGAGSLALAHPGHDHKILGTVTMAAADHVMVKDKAGKDVTVHINAETKIMQAKKALRVEDIKPGMRIVVTAVTVKEADAEKMVAKVIELGAPATSK